MIFVSSDMCQMVALTCVFIDIHLYLYISGRNNWLCWRVCFSLLTVAILMCLKYVQFTVSIYIKKTATCQYITQTLEGCAIEYNDRSDFYSSCCSSLSLMG